MSDDIIQTETKPNIHWLKVTGVLTLHTRNAQRFFWGQLKDTPSIPAFNRQIWAIKNAMIADDPFAEWILLRTYDALVQTYRALHQLEQETRQLLISEEGMVFKLANSTAPLELNIQFSNPYTRAALHLLAVYDRVLRGLLAAQTSCLKQSTKEREQKIKMANDRLREVLNMPSAWKEFNVTRQDVLINTPKAQEAAEFYKSLGTLPPAVLNGMLHAPMRVEFT
jgi:integrating conjugative element protein (TIGR03761 family)